MIQGFFEKEEVLEIKTLESVLFLFSVQLLQFDEKKAVLNIFEAEINLHGNSEIEWNQVLMLAYD